MQTEKKRKRKPGGGRKKGEGSKPVRVPLSKVDAVYEYIRTGKITTIHPMP